VDVKTWKKEYYEDCLDSVSFTAVLDDRGRISIPASVRRKLRIGFRSIIDTKVKSLKRRIKK
jgi:bifunctional DNA-binding transcriptional regulator/antitoxin component of YhaV-PrlF toxin-antitoxin module